MSVTLNPPYEEWGAILASNRAVAAALHKIVGQSTVDAVRRDLLEAAVQYQSEIREWAGRLGISILDRSSGRQRNEAPIVMAGHQPVVYHPGILEKTKRLRALADDVSGLALNIAIDTDEGDGGRLLWPLATGDDVVIKQKSVSAGGGIYRDQRVVAQGESATIFGEMIQDLGASGCSSAIAGAEEAARLYGALAGEPIVLANAIVRMSLGGEGYDEVPLSLLAEAPSVREFLYSIVRDGERFTGLYNATLERYRAEHRIKNPANPFPNMDMGDEEIELPLWEIVEGSRKGIRIPRGGTSPITNLIAPRGSIVTLLLRGLCCELFVHGLGGGKYDHFVNAFAKALWGAPLPTFVVASATKYLFPARVERYLHAREVKAKYKEMVSHTAAFMGQGLFSPEDEKLLAPLLDRRQELLPRMRHVQSKEERSAVAHQLNEVNRLIKSGIDASSLAPLLAEGGIDDARLNRWACREYAFFLFREL
jgi:hypothetical protein